MSKASSGLVVGFIAMALVLAAGWIAAVLWSARQRGLPEIGFLSAPIPLRMFHNEPANIWITQFPFVWLSAVMVATALLGHILVFRRLRDERNQRGAPETETRPEARTKAAV